MAEHSYNIISPEPDSLFERMAGLPLDALAVPHSRPYSPISRLYRALPPNQCSRGADWVAMGL
jgi:hypothetical protein